MNSTLDEQSSFLQNFQDILSRLIKQRAIVLPISFMNKAMYSLDGLQKIVEYNFAEGSDKIIFECILKESFISQKFKGDLYSTFLQDKIHIMTFAQLIFYKTLPCPLWDKCPKKPREIAPANQYQDEEFLCFYYHHEKDRRRVIIPVNLKEDFVYTANYNKNNETQNLEKFSLNYFESMFHPIYYKLFKCKRNNCNQITLCPFVHYDIEKSIWDEIFKKYTLKPRDVLTKKKILNSSIFTNQYNYQHELDSQNSKIQSLPDYSALIDLGYKNNTPLSLFHPKGNKIKITLDSKEFHGNSGNLVQFSESYEKNERVTQRSHPLGEKIFVSKLNQNQIQAQTQTQTQTQSTQIIDDSYDGESDTSFDRELRIASSTHQFSQSYSDIRGNKTGSLDFFGMNLPFSMSEMQQSQTNRVHKSYNILMNGESKKQNNFNKKKDNLDIPTDPNLKLYFDMELMKNLHKIKKTK